MVPVQPANAHAVRAAGEHRHELGCDKDSQGENTMIADYGSNLQLCPEDLDNASDSIRGADLILLQGEVPESANLHAASIAKNAGVPVIINPAPMSFSELRIFREAYLITPNLVEIEALAGLAEKNLFSETNPFRKAEDLIDSRIIGKQFGIMIPHHTRTGSGWDHDGILFIEQVHLFSGDGSGLFRKAGVICRLAAASLLRRKYDLNPILLEQVDSRHTGCRIKHVYQAGTKVIDSLRVIRIGAHKFLLSYCA